VESRLLLDVVIRKSTAILQLFACKDKTLLIRWNTFLVLDLGFDIGDSVRGFHIERNGLTRQSLHENLHASSQSKNQVEGGFLLDVVIGKSTAILQLFACKYKTLLIRWNTFFVLDLSFDIGDSIRGFYVKRNCLSCQGLHENLHASSQSKY